MSDGDTQTPGAGAQRPSATTEADADAVKAAATLVALAEYADLHAPAAVPHLTLRALAAVGRSAAVGLTELGRALHITPASTSRLCGRLESAGLLARHAHGADRRKSLLTLTPAGEEVMEEMRAACARAIAPALPHSAAQLQAVKAACEVTRDCLRGVVGEAENGWKGVQRDVGGAARVPEAEA
ncbi:MarR family transcriptional regulator [Streptomyces sp. NPDC006368]|uniref:MarR family winged helix-turn-helix transcriptional regulator n=1 Tax=Streptomyces sp. NPDC006368 TaxID=3156760 RepID=UPI0033BBC973